MIPIQMSYTVCTLGGHEISRTLFIYPEMIFILKPGVGLVVRVAAWDPRVLIQAPLAAELIHQEVDSACHPSKIGKMSTSVLVRGTLHQQHSRVPTNDATSSHRLQSIERIAVPISHIFPNFSACNAGHLELHTMLLSTLM